MTQIQIIALVSVVVYIAIILILAHVLAKKSRAVGASGGRLPWFIIAATTMATIMNAAQLLGNAGSAYSLGVSQMFWTNAFAALGTMILVPLVGERLRSVNCATLSDVTTKRFPKVRSVSILLNAWFFIWGIFACSLSIFGGAVVLQMLLGVNFWVAAGATVVVALIYNALGGLEAMSVMDTVQYIFVGLLVAILTPILFIKFGTFSSFCAALVGTTGYDLTAAGEALGITGGFFDMFHLPGWGAAGFIAYVCACSMWQCCDMGVIQRFLAERKPGDGVKGVRTYCLIFFPTLSLIVFFGLWGRGLFPSLDYVDSVTLRAGEAALGNVGIVLFMLATVAAILSTVGAYLNALGLTVSGFWAKRKPDSSPKTLKIVENAAILVLGIVSLIASKVFGTAGITLTAIALQMCMVATISPMMALMVSWKKFNGKAAFWGCLAGLVVSIASTIYSGGAYAAILGDGFFGIPTLFLGWIVCIPIYIIGSLLTKTKEDDMSPEFRAVFEDKRPYVGKKDLVISVILIVVLAVFLAFAFSGKFGAFPTFTSTWGAIDVILMIFSAIALFGCLFLSYKLIRFIYIDKDFFEENSDTSAQIEKE